MTEVVDEDGVGQQNLTPERGLASQLADHGAVVRRFSLLVHIAATFGNFGQISTRG